MIIPHSHDTNHMFAVLSSGVVHWHSRPHILLRQHARHMRAPENVNATLGVCKSRTYLAVRYPSHTIIGTKSVTYARLLTARVISECVGECVMIVHIAQETCAHGRTNVCRDRQTRLIYQIIRIMCCLKQSPSPCPSSGDGARTGMARGIRVVCLRRPDNTVHS